jgi:hypothetical protein
MTVEKWAELHELIDALVEGQITEEQAERLSVWLAVDEDAQKVYVQALDVHANMLCDFGGEPAEQAAPPSTNVPASAAAIVADESIIAAPSPTDVPVSPPSTTYCTQPAERRHSLWLRLFSTPQLSIATSICVLLMAFTVVAAGERILRAIFHQHEVEPHKAGGAVTSPGATSPSEIRSGASPVGTRRIGSSQIPDTALVNLLVFRLPRLEEFERVGLAKLEWSYRHRAGKPNFSVDLYGLGYVSSTSSLSGCFWEGSQDTTRRIDYGMSGKATRRVSQIARGVMNPQTARGRVPVEGPELAAFLQSLYDDGARGGDFVVFRLNADKSTTKVSRRTGYEIVHPPEIPGKTFPAQFPALQITAKGDSPESDSAVPGSAITAHCIEPSQWSAALVSSDSIAQLGPSKHGTRLIGSSSRRNTALTNLLVFRLPKLEELERVRSARLEWTYHVKAGDPQFAVDLYGLGCVSSAASLSKCFWEGDFDSSLRSEYGMLGDAGRPVALVARGVINPRTAKGRVVVEGRELVEFLQSLYDDGAHGGELVVFRLNADAPTAGFQGRMGYEIVHPPEVPGKTVAAEFPLLELIPSLDEGS